MKHIRKFNKWTDYKAYLDAGDIYLPRVTLIVNKGDTATVTDQKNDNGPTWLDFSKIGNEFIEIANEGTMYFTDMDGYHAEILDNETIKITGPESQTGKVTIDGESVKVVWS